MAVYHTWPHSYYLARQCNGMGEWEKVRLKYKRCGCEISNLMEGETGNFVPFILPGSRDPYPAPLTPIRLP